MKFLITALVDAYDQEAGELARSEVAESLQDAIDCGELADIDIGAVELTCNESCPEVQFFRDLAANTRHVDGDIEFDDEPVVSLGAEEGAYVQAWVWIPGNFEKDPQDE